MMLTSKVMMTPSDPVQTPWIFCCWCYKGKKKKKKANKRLIVSIFKINPIDNTSVCCEIKKLHADFFFFLFFALKYNLAFSCLGWKHQSNNQSLSHFLICNHKKASQVVMIMIFCECHANYLITLSLEAISIHMHSFHSGGTHLAIAYTFPKSCI